MAMKLQDLLKQEMPVICVCHHMHISAIWKLLQQDIPVHSHERILLPTRTGRICESDIPRITNEIPYHMYLYDLFRDTPVHRDEWIEKGCLSIEMPEDVETIKNIIGYSKKIALTRGRRNPDISCILTASQCCTDDQYTQELRRILLSYPPADKESDENITQFQDYNFQYSDNSTFNESQIQTPWNKMGLDRMNIIHRNRSNYYIIPRIPESILNELKARKSFSVSQSYFWLLKYFSNKYRSYGAGDSCHALPFVAGIGEGLAVRETLRNVFRDQIFIQDQELINNASYVFNFGGKPKTSIFYYKRRSLLGFVKKRKNHYMFTHAALFAQSKKHIQWYRDELDIKEPFNSTLMVALKYSDKVYMFSEIFPDLPLNKKDRSKIFHIPLSRIPKHILSWVKDFYATN